MRVLARYTSALRSGHWPTLMLAWVHLTVSFMVWLVIGADASTVASALDLTDFQIGIAVAIPLFSGAVLRIVGGWSCDRFGPKTTALGVLLAELIAVLVGIPAKRTYEGLLLLGMALGTGGASFAVALPLASRAYPSRHQGLVMGIAASGNVGAVFITFLAPRVSARFGEDAVFVGLGCLVVLALGLIQWLVPADRNTVVAPAKGWWHDAEALLRRRSAYALCFVYAVTFGGFVGFSTSLPLYFSREFAMDPITAGSLAALSTSVGSLIRPWGGAVADRTGGAWVLARVCPFIGAFVVLAGWLAAIDSAVAVMIIAVALMGFGNGAVFQLVAVLFPKQVGLASGLVGAAGSLGGFFLPLALGAFKTVTGSFIPGFLMYAAIATVGAVAAAQLRKGSEVA